jgi:DNA-binding NarL/FixJ family response regulator
VTQAEQPEDVRRRLGIRDFFGHQATRFKTDPDKPGRQPCKLCRIIPNRDQEIWRWAEEGASDREIARRLGNRISHKNVAHHLVHLQNRANIGIVRPRVRREPMTDVIG